MKKVLALALALVMVFSLAACSGKNGLPNPMTKVASMDELSKLASCALISPEGATDEKFFTIDTDPMIAEYQFKVDGIEYTLRFSNVDVDTDICGVYKDDGTYFEGDTAENSYIENDDYILHRWFTVDGQYVLMVDKSDNEASWEQFDPVQKQFMDVEPVNWNSEVPFADYKAIEGSYSNDTAYASILIRYDHVLVGTLLQLEDGTRQVWYMDATLDGDKLIYDKTEIEANKYNEETNETEVTFLPDGPEGYIIVKDGKLDYSECGTEELKDLVLDYMVVSY